MEWFKIPLFPTQEAQNQIIQQELIKLSKNMQMPQMNALESRAGAEMQLNQWWGLSPVFQNIHDIRVQKQKLQSSITVSSLKMLCSDSEVFLKDIRSGIIPVNGLDEKCGMTPLMACACLGKTDVGIQLIKFGALIDLKNDNNYSALSVACVTDQYEFVKLLVGSKADVNQKEAWGVSPHILAVLCQNEYIVKHLLKNGAEINLKTPEGYSALFLAASRGFTDIVEMLIAKGAEIDSRDLLGMSPLLQSAFEGHHEVVTVLLEKGADANAVNHEGNTALYISAIHNRPECVRKIVDFADVCQATASGVTPLMAAAASGNISIIPKLLKKGATKSVNAVDRNGMTALHNAALNGDRHTIKILIDATANTNLIDNTGNTALIYACQSGNEKCVKLLLDHKSEEPITAEIYKALFTAVQKDHKLVVKALIHFLKTKKQTLSSLPGAYKTMPLLNSAIKAGKKEIANMLINAGANANEADALGQFPLFHCAQLGHSELAMKLIEAKADVNLSDWNGNTPLIVAADLGKTEMIKLLLKKGVSTNVINRKAHTALMCAACNGHLDAVKILSQTPCNLDQVDSMGWTALMLASQFGHTSTVQFLLEKGSSYNCSSRYDLTALLISVANGRLETVNALIRHGANKNESNCVGTTPMLMAASRGHDAIVKFLLNLGVSVKVHNLDRSTPLHFAALGKHYNTVKILTEAKAEVNALDKSKRTPLMLSTLTGDALSCSCLLHYGADINLRSPEGWTCLMLCSQRGWTDCMEILLEASPETIDAEENLGHTALNICAANGHSDAVDLLLDKGADPCIANNMGFNPLMLSSNNGHVQIVNSLLNGKKKIVLERAEKTNGQTALHLAVSANHLQIVKALINCGADINTQDKTLTTPLNVCAARGFNRVASELIRKKAIVDKADSRGMTPLLTCIERGSNVLAHLIKAGASVRKKNREGDNAFALSIKHKRLHILQLLLKTGPIKVAEKEEYIESAKKCGFSEAVEILQRCTVEVPCPTQNASGNTLDITDDESTTSVLEIERMMDLVVTASSQLEASGDEVSETDENKNRQVINVFNLLSTDSTDKNIHLDFTNANFQNMILNLNSPRLENSSNICLGPGATQTVNNYPAIKEKDPDF